MVWSCRAGGGCRQRSAPVPGPLSPKKALKNGLFSPFGAELIVVDNPLLPDTPSAAGRYAAYWHSTPSIRHACPDRQRGLEREKVAKENFDAPVITEQADVGRQGLRPANKGRR
jgi:hypothetical protein